MKFTLRDYQRHAVDSVIAKLHSGYKRVLLVLPTGGGKTAISSELAQMCYAKGNSSTFICHRRELITQTAKTFLKHDLEASFIQGGRRYAPDNPVQIASINTLVNRLDDIPLPDVLFIDEAQHTPSTTWDKVATHYKNSVHIGLTATPIRLDGKSLGKYYDCIVEVCSTKWLIEQGYLVNYQYYAPSVIDTSKLDIRNGEYTNKSLEKANFESKIVGDNIEYYKRHAMGKRNVIFARNVKQSMKIVKRYNDEGIPAKHLDGKTPLKERDQAIKDFAEGKILVLSNVDLFGEGFDLPSIEVVSLLTVSNSLSRVIQWWGRGLRPVYDKRFDLSTKEGRLQSIAESDKKFAIILDHGSNYEQHLLPDVERVWSLEEHEKVKRKKAEDDGIAIKRCPVCFSPHTPAIVCPFCGHVYEANGKDIKEVAGELYLINSDEYQEALNTEIRTVETFEELIALEKEKGYKNGWAENKWHAKTGIDLRNTLSGCQKIADARGHKRGWAYHHFNSRRVRR